MEKETIYFFAFIGSSTGTTTTQIISTIRANCLSTAGQMRGITKNTTLYLHIGEEVANEAVHHVTVCIGVERAEAELLQVLAHLFSRVTAPHLSDLHFGKGLTIIVHRHVVCVSS